MNDTAPAQDPVPEGVSAKEGHGHGPDFHQQQARAFLDWYASDFQHGHGPDLHQQQEGMPMM